VNNFVEYIIIYRRKMDTNITDNETTLQENVSN